MTAPLIVHLVRHGEVHNPDNVLYARLPGFFLSETGREQARSAGDYLSKRPITALYASPMERAQQTAEIIAGAHSADLSIQTDENLHEILTPYEGASHDDMAKINYEFYDDLEPPYETPADIRRRIRAFIASARHRHPGDEVIGVTHGDNLVVMFLYAIGKPEHEIGRYKLAGWGLPDPYPQTASILTLVYRTDNPEEVPSWRYVRPY